ncbi:DinB family protein [Paenibacillus sp. sptzw28]|uniref:DinB family protein n=1 Tax=Paenibacillus sp. sptzw28 TaxID=715179 RepID=UPI001C6E5172|nr:DinB family protein [Paenibacillus sp. sptzw28]QYR22577.1 DinB family protein [Paenibacillus sp. sptzw28]
MNKPKEGDFNPQWGRYINAVQEGDLVQLLKDQEQDLLSLYSSFSEEQSFYRYDEGKWSLKEVLGHIIDTERIMSYRLLCAARGDKTPLPRHQDIFVNGTSFDRRPLAELIAEFCAVRTASITLVQGLNGEELRRAGVINNAATTAVALAYFIIGHALHHLNVVREKYLMPH